jgi:hypothetical protein
VIVATAYRKRVLEAFDSGADDLVGNPFHLGELAARVRSGVRIQHPTDASEPAAAYIHELQKDLPRLCMEGNRSVAAQRQRRQSFVEGMPRNGQGGVNQGPDGCRHYPECSRLEHLFADPPVGPSSISLPQDAEPICRGCEHFEPRRER